MRNLSKFLLKFSWPQCLGKATLHNLVFSPLCQVEFESWQGHLPASWSWIMTELPMLSSHLLHMGNISVYLMKLLWVFIKIINITGREELRHFNLHFMPTQNDCSKKKFAQMMSSNFLPMQMPLYEVLWPVNNTLYLLSFLISPTSSSIPLFLVSNAFYSTLILWTYSINQYPF